MIIEEFTRVERNSLVGFATVRAPSGLIFHDVSIHRKDGKWWASPASKPMLGRDGVQIKDAAGKAKWSPVVSFTSRDVRDKFSAAIIEALKAARPEVFE
jgi:hypothetical protein